MKLMLDCRALAQLLSQSQDDAPPLSVRARMRMRMRLHLHLMTGQDWRNVDEQMRFVRKAMQAVRVHPPRVDYEAPESRAFMQRHEVQGFPSLLVLSVEGALVRRVPVSLDPATLSASLRG